MRHPCAAPPRDRADVAQAQEDFHTELIHKPSGAGWDQPGFAPSYMDSSDDDETGGGGLQKSRAPGSPPPPVPLNAIARFPRRAHRPHAARATAVMSEGEGDYVGAVLANIGEGNWGERGEVFFAGQAALLVGVLLGPSALADPCRLLGIGALGAGGALVISGARALGTSLTPWPAPTSANELRTEGPYASCRHPMYGGLLLLCAGASLVSASYVRLLLTGALLALLSAKAAREDAWLEEKHGEGYRAWAEGVPPFFPAGIDGARGVIDAVLG